MGDPTETDIRTTIGITDTDVLTSARVTLALADAKTSTGQTDEIALRFYTCFLIADQWDTINGTISIEGITFRIPNSGPFLNAYNKRLKDLNLSSGNASLMEKVSTNPDLSYDTTTNRLRRREGGDPYY